MATKTATPETRGMRRPLLPYVPRRQNDPGVQDKTQALWPWYLVPFNVPDVSPECRAFVMGEYETDDEEEIALLRSELVDARTIRGDGNTAITQQPGSCSAVRQDYAHDGFRLISPIAGEADSGLNLWEPQIESGHAIGRTLTDPFVGLRDVVEDLGIRQKWQLAQLDAKIATAQERMKDETGESKRYQRAIVSALRRRRGAVENGLPTVKELQLFFKKFELQRLESTQDVKLKQAQATQGQIDNTSRDIARLTSEIAEGGAAWPPAGSERVEEA